MILLIHNSEEDLMEDNWYSLTTEDVLEKLNVDKSGLTNKTVKNNQEKYGLNVLPKKKRDNDKNYLLNGNQEIISIVV